MPPQYTWSCRDGSISSLMTHDGGAHDDLRRGGTRHGESPWRRPCSHDWARRILSMGYGRRETGHAVLMWKVRASMDERVRRRDWRQSGRPPHLYPRLRICTMIQKRNGNGKRNNKRKTGEKTSPDGVLRGRRLVCRIESVSEKNIFVKQRNGSILLLLLVQ